MTGDLPYAHLVEDTLAEIAGFAARRPLPVIGSTVALALIAGILAAWLLQINTSTSAMIAQDLPFRQDFFDRNKAFPALENNIIAVVEANDPDVARDATRALVSSLSSQNTLFTDVYSPGVSRFFEEHALLYLPRKDFQTVTDRIQESAGLLEGLARQPSLPGLAGVLGQAAQGGGRGLPDGFATFLDTIRTTAASRLNGKPEPVNWARTLAGGAGSLPGAGPQTRRYFVFMKPTLDFTALEPAKRALDAARQSARNLKVSRAGSVSVSFTGEAAMASEELRTVFNGAWIAALISLTLVTCVLVFGVRSWRLVAASVAMLLTGLLLTAGFAAVTIGELNLISVAFAVLFVGLGIDFAIHFALRFEEEGAIAGHAPEVLEVVAASTGPALLLCTVTTTLAFLAFAPTDFAGMAQLGVISAGGMVIALTLSLTLLPAILAVLPAGKGKPKSALLNWSIPTPGYRIRKPATLVILFVGLVALYTAPSARFDGDPIALKDPDAEAVQVFKRLRVDRETPAYIGELVVRDAREAQESAQRLGELFEVREVVSALSFVPSNQAPRLQKLANLARIFPDKPATAVPNLGRQVRAQALDLLIQALSGLETSDAAADKLKQSALQLRRTAELLKQEAGNAELLRQFELDLFGELPAAIGELKRMLSAQRITVDSLEPELRRRYLSEDGRYRLDILPQEAIKDNLAMRRFVSGIRGAEEHATGWPVEIVKGADVVAKAMLQATGVAALCIAIVLFLALRRIGDVLLVLCPIALAGIFLVAATVAFGIPFNFANVIVLPLLIGLGVDSGIHLVMRAREEFEAAETRELLKTSTPRAVLLSALTTIASFGALAVSAHRGTASMGELLTIAIIFTLVCTLIVLPTLVDWFVRPRQPRRVRR
ncbi:MAG: MMPL family transporter [Pseudomonadota bacterium]